MKFTSIVCLLLLIAVKSFAQSDSITLLSCNTWGKPDWTRLQQHDGHTLAATGSSIREDDNNINALSPAYAEVYGDHVFLRWMLKDTTVFYTITVSNDQDEAIFTTRSNRCGIHIPFGILRQEYSLSVLRVQVERKKNQGINRGISFTVDEARKSYRKQIEEELLVVLAKISPEQRTIATVDYFLSKRRFSEALNTLELAIEKDPGNLDIQKKYWLTLNDLFINRAIR